uniref:Uncharacterized protein n=1 Tax=Chromera velia CCMP2878 TaxID=1169474 RepID=A0A0G4I3Z3_9ALVE|eukprot:Cvel_1788.t1-p1 / transcript=Cvel_1788.t1 / gene=Cvel_1788 / organism=Chromera_velia_CCMP2878 / gene_product=Golgin subfamily B member 1, putative / transcript_product=Golgin subfamily B member 1, putative / location=Cvel_scaffold65:139791-142733(-) / protein_length=981 / sequence_SO=supercontig / SO=protein_coding / is_pseudo=false
MTLEEAPSKPLGVRLQLPEGASESAGSPAAITSARRSTRHISGEAVFGKLRDVVELLSNLRNEDLINGFDTARGSADSNGDSAFDRSRTIESIEGGDEKDGEGALHAILQRRETRKSVASRASVFRALGELDSGTETVEGDKSEGGERQITAESRHPSITDTDADSDVVAEREESLQMISLISSLVKSGFRGAMDSLRGQIRQLTSEKTHLEIRLNQYEKENREQADLVDALSDQLTKQLEQNRKLQQNSNQMEKDFADAQQGAEIAEELEADNRRLRERGKQLADALKACKEDNERLSSKLHSTDHLARLNHLSKKVQQQEETITDLRTQLLHSQTSLADKEASVARLQNALRAQQDKIVELEDAAAAMRDEDDPFIGGGMRGPGAASEGRAPAKSLMAELSPLMDDEDPSALFSQRPSLAPSERRGANAAALESAQLRCSDLEHKVCLLSRELQETQAEAERCAVLAAEGSDAAARTAASSLEAAESDAALLMLAVVRLTAAFREVQRAIEKGGFGGGLGRMGMGGFGYARHGPKPPNSFAVPAGWAPQMLLWGEGGGQGQGGGQPKKSEASSSRRESVDNHSDVASEAFSLMTPTERGRARYDDEDDDEEDDEEDEMKGTALIDMLSAETRSAYFFFLRVCGLPSLLPSSDPRLIDLSCKASTSCSSPLITARTDTTDLFDCSEGLNLTNPGESGDVDGDNPLFAGFPAAVTAAMRMRAAKLRAERRKRLMRHTHKMKLSQGIAKRLAPESIPEGDEAAEIEAERRAEEAARAREEREALPASSETDGSSLWGIAMSLAGYTLDATSPKAETARLKGEREKKKSKHRKEKDRDREKGVDRHRERQKEAGDDATASSQPGGTSTGEGAEGGDSTLGSRWEQIKSTAWKLLQEANEDFVTGKKKKKKKKKRPPPDETGANVPSSSSAVPQTVEGEGEEPEDGGGKSLSSAFERKAREKADPARERKEAAHHFEDGAQDDS